MCGRKFFNLLKVLTLKFEVCGREVFELLKASNFKRVKESSSHCYKFQVKFQGCAIKVFQVFKVSFSSLCEMSKDFFQNFQFFSVQMFILSFVFKMSSFQMESLKIMEKFDGGNCHLWKFKMHMMISKHGLWKFINGSTTLPSEEVIRVDYTKKKTKAFTLLCEHLIDAQLAHVQYCDNVRSAWEAFCNVHETKIIGNKLFFQKRFFTIKM